MKLLKRLWSCVKYAVYMGAAFVLVTAWPSVAMGMAGVWASMKVKDEYLKIMLGAIAGVLAGALLVNYAELAVLLVAFPVADFLSTWKHHIEAA